MKLMAYWVAASSFAGLSAHGAVIATDAYKIGADPSIGEYQATVAIKNQPATLVNTGFVNGPYGSGSGTSQFSATTTGLISAGANSDATTGKVNYGAAPLDANVRSNARNLSPAAPASGTYYVSHLMQRGNIPQAAGAGFVLTGFGNAIVPAPGTTTGNLAGLFVGFAQNGVTDNFGNLVIRHRNTGDTATTPTTADVVLVDGATTSTFGLNYHVVMKIDLNVSGDADAVSWWLNPTDGSSDASLTSTAAASGTFNSFALTGAADLARLNYTSFQWNGNAFFDEPRLATDLAGLSLAVPEPAGLAALGLAALLLGRRRRGA